MIGIILVTHGKLAEEFKHAMEHVVGRQEAVATYVQQRQPTTPAAPENPCTVSLTPHAAGGAGLGLGQGRLF